MLQARERVEQMKEEKKKQIEQKFAQIDEKTEKVRASGWWAAMLGGGGVRGHTLVGPKQVRFGAVVSGRPSPGLWGISWVCRGTGCRVLGPFCRAE